jgi:hypothetical protein
MDKEKLTAKHIGELAEKAITAAVTSFADTDMDKSSLDFHRGCVTGVGALALAMLGGSSKEFAVVDLLVDSASMVMTERHISKLMED